jgi:hypothetical protein
MKANGPTRTTGTRTAHSVLGFGRLIVEHLDANGSPKTGRLEDITTGTHVSATGTITAITLIPSRNSDSDPIGAGVIITGTDRTKGNLEISAALYQRVFGDLVEGDRIQATGTVIEGDDFTPPLITVRAVRRMTARPPLMTLVGGAR